MGAEQGGEQQQPEDGDPDAAECFVRRIVIDPGKHLLIDVSGKTAITTGEKAVRAGVAGTSFAINLGRKLVGSEVTEPLDASADSL